MRSDRFAVVDRLNLSRSLAGIEVGRTLLNLTKDQWIFRALGPILVFITISATAQTTYTWNGSVSSAWNLNSNWTPNTGFPLAPDHAVIATGANQPLLDVNRSVTNLAISSGTLDLNGRTLMTTGVGSYSGGVMQNGTLALNAPAATQTFAGTTFSCPVTGTASIILLNGSVFNSAVTLTKTNNGNDYSLGGNVFNNTLSITAAAGRWYMYHAANDSFNGDVKVNSTGASAGVWLGHNTGTGTLAAGKTVSVGGGGFSSGSLNIRRFTQLGSTPQTLTLTGSSTLYFSNGTVFNGAMTSTSPGLYIQNSTFNANATFTKTGSANEYSSGGCFFNGTTEFYNSGVGFLALNNSGVDVFNGNVKFNSSGPGGYQFGYNSGGAWSQAAGYTISIGAGGFSDGTLALGKFVQLGTSPITLVLTGTANFSYKPGTLFNGPVDVVSPRIVLAGAVFNGPAKFTKTGPNDDYSPGGAVWNSTAEFNSTSSGVFAIHYYANDQFNGDVRVGNTGSGIIQFGSNSFTGTLAAGKSIAVGAMGFNSGTLSLYDFIQLGTTPQNLIMGTGATLMFGVGSVFNADVTSVSGRSYLNGSTFNGGLSVTKNGSGNDVCRGGNTYNGEVNITSASTDILYMYYYFSDAFNADLRLSSTSNGQILMGQGTAGATLANGRTIAVGASGFASGTLNVARFQQVGNTAQNLVLGTSALLVFDVGTVFNGNVSCVSGRLVLNSSTFNGNLTATKNGPGNDVCGGGNIFNALTDFTNASTGSLYLYYYHDDAFNGDLKLSNTATGEILLGQASALGVLAAGRTISVGSGGFIYGRLVIGRFTQVGSTPQVLALGSNATLVYEVGTVFNGDIVSTSGRLYFNGTTFNGTLTATKTGSGNDVGTGGNTFNGTTDITVASSGILYMYYYNIDVFNADLHLSSTSNGQFLLGNGTGSAVLAAGRTISVGSGGFNDGILAIGGFTQTGATPQFFTLGTNASLMYEAGTTFNGNVTSTSGRLYFNGTTFNGTVSATKNGTGNDTSRGGNTFNGITDLTMTAFGYVNLYYTSNDLFNADVRFNNTSTGQFRLGLNTGTGTLAAGRTIAVGSAGFSGGLLSIEKFTQLGTTSQVLTLAPAASLVFGIGTTFNGNVTSTSGSLFFNGTTFNGSVTATKTSSTNDSSRGGNVFNGLTEITMAGGGYLNLYYTVDDLYNADLRFNNATTGQVRLGLSTGSAVLAAGRTIAVGSTGFTAGMLSIDRFTQMGSTSQNLNLGSAATLTYGVNTTFNGNVTSTSGSLFFNGTTFNGTIQATKTGSSNDSSRGGNIFNGFTDIRMIGGGYLNLYYTVDDAYNGDLRLSNTSTGQVRMGLNAGSAVLAAGRTIAIGPLGFVNGVLSIEKFTQVGSTPQNLILSGGANLTYGAGTIFNGDVNSVSPGLRFTGVVFNGTATCQKIGPSNDNGTGTNTFNGTTRLTNTGSGILYLGYSGTDLFNGDLALGSTNNGGIIFGQANGSAVLANAKNLSIAPTGYTAGPLNLRNFTQLGAIPNSIALSGSAVLRFQTGTNFQGAIIASAPDLYLDGSTFQGASRFIKNGATYNPSYGGNTFYGDMSFYSQGGYVLLSNYVTDEYYGNALFRRTGSGAFNIGNIPDVNFRKDVSTLGSTGQVNFGVGTGRTRFVGNTTQYVRNEVAWPPSVRFMILATTAGAEVQLVGGNVNVTSDISFTSGNTRSTAATSAGPGMLILADNITMSDPPDNNSHVIGYVRKVGNDAFDFPVGDGTRYAPISISAPAGTSHHFTAKYEHQSSHPTYSHLLRDPTLDHLSLCEYWILDRTGSSTDPVVTLSWDTPRSCGVTDLSELAVARWNGTMWKNHGNGSTTGNTTTGKISTAGAVNLFATPSLFTLGSTGFGNPLPIELVTFNAQFVEDAVRTEWTTASEMNNDRFDVERSSDAISFELAGSVFGAGNSQAVLNYEFVDMHPYSGASYYRLKQIDFDGTFTFSDIVPVNNPNGSLASITIFPNPTQGDAVISIQGTVDGTIELSVINAQGQQVLNYSRTVTVEGLMVPISMEGLPSGIYVVRMQEQGQLAVDVKVLKE